MIIHVKNTSFQSRIFKDHIRHTNILTEICCEITIDGESIDINKNNAWMEGRIVELDVMLTGITYCLLFTKYGKYKTYLNAHIPTYIV